MNAPCIVSIMKISTRKTILLVVATLALFSLPIEARSQTVDQAETEDVGRLRPLNPQILAYLKWTLTSLPPKGETQAAIFAHIENKVGQKIVVPIFPRESPDDVIGWYQERWLDFAQLEDKATYAKKNLKGIYTRHAEDLLVAQQMMQSPDLKWRQKGLTLARFTALRGPLYTEDTWLGARIEEGFILPSLDLAYAEPTDGQSWSFLLQDAASRFRKNQEYEKQCAVLQIHISVETMPGRRDNSRKHLAWTLEKMGRFSEAISVWETIEVDVSEKISTIEKLKAKIAAQ